MENQLTKLQRSRIEFHTDLESTRGLLALSFNIRASTYSPVKLLQIVGNLEVATPEQTIIYEGVPLATKNSALGRCEDSFNRLSSETVEDSLLVKKAGKIELRSDEYKARLKVYKGQVNHLKQILGFPESNGRAQLDL